jgi:hypothetical protein
VAVFTQLPAQLVCPDWHISVQTPAEHTSPAAHARPQAPQFARSLCRATSQPLPATPSQFAKFVAQAPSAQVPKKHCADAFA